MEVYLETILKNCQPYIKALEECEKGLFLIRGTQKQDIGMCEEHTISYTNRTLRDTPQDLHDFLNKKFETELGWKARNGVFCYGCNILKKNPTNSGYGKNYMIFPKGKFDFAYSKSIYDLSKHIVGLEKINYKEIADSIKYENDSLHLAMNSGEKVKGLSNEIMINTQTYYYVDFKLKENLIKMIWE